MKAILVDDESLALEVLENLLEPFGEVEIIGTYTNPCQALDIIREGRVDIVFLDIEMGAYNGIEVAQSYINEKPDLNIIFVTAYSHYAVEAFDLNALDYLLKPIQEKRLEKAIDRLLINQSNKSNSQAVDNEGNYLQVNSFGKFEIRTQDGELLGWRTQKTKELFAYLWIHDDRPVSKYIIMDTIFPDREPEKAATNLHTTVYQLRRSLKDLGFPKGIIYKNESYFLDLEVKSDLSELKGILEKKILKKGDAKRISQLYKGDFLEEESYPWLMDIQYNYKEKVFNKLEDFVEDRINNRDLDEILKASIDTLLRIDPFRECAARNMIHYYGENDMKANLKTFYEEYRDKLWREMKLRPMVETIDLYRQYI